MADISRDTQLDRACATLFAAAIGDALGMPTQDLSREVIAQDYGHITGFLAAGPSQAIAHGAPAGMITDDTEQLLILARLLIEDGRVDPRRFASELASWQDDMIRRGSQDLLGPSTNRAIERIRAGVAIREVGLGGRTNGAAMRVAPVGIACAPAQVARGVIEASVLTHNTATALAAAGVVAGMVCAGIDGADRGTGLAAGFEVAEICAAAGPGVDEFIPRALWAASRLAGAKDLEATIAEIGTSVDAAESVAAVYALVSVVDDPWEAMLIAARAGGDTDTVASIAGAMLGATHGMSALPAHAIDTVVTVNGLDLHPVAAGLLQRRSNPLKGYPHV